MTAARTMPACARLRHGGPASPVPRPTPTARRLGAVVSATDVAPCGEEQVESLGAKFIAVEERGVRQAETRAVMPRKCRRNTRPEAKAELVAAHIAKQGSRDHNRAVIPVRPAPVLIDRGPWSNP